MSDDHYIYDVESGTRYVELSGNKVLTFAAVSDDREAGFVYFVDAPDTDYQAGIKAKTARDDLGIDESNIEEKAGVALCFTNPTSILTLIRTICDAYTMMLGDYDEC